MKSILVTILLLSSFRAYATSTDIFCYDRGNSDYELRLVMSADGKLQSVALINQDWGAAGFGDLQPVTLDKDNTYHVSALSQAQTGFAVGTLVQVNFGRGAVVESAIVNGDIYENCQ